jgi:hypothetical protein
VDAERLPDGGWSDAVIRALRDSLTIREALAGVVRDARDRGGSPAEVLARLLVATDALTEEDVRWALISALMDQELSSGRRGQRDRGGAP